MGPIIGLIRGGERAHVRLKKKGILGLGAFVVNSKSLVVLWTPRPCDFCSVHFWVWR